MSQVAVTLPRLLGYLPLHVLYVLADMVVYPLVRHVVRYRRSVVEKNLGLAFPDKSDDERRQIERAFYHQLCDVLVETIYLQRMGREEMARRFTWVNSDFLCTTAGSKTLTLCYAAHYGNWEWLVGSMATDRNNRKAFIYHPLHHAGFDRWLASMRQRFDTTLIDMEHAGETLQTLNEERETSYTIFALSDQLPKEQYVRHFHRFMGIKSKVLTGTEQLIRNYNMEVYFCRVRRIRRGYYSCETIPLTPAAGDSSPYPYTDAYIDCLEQQILEAPELWLWSHDRWRR